MTATNTSSSEPDIKTLLANLDQYTERLGEGNQAVAYRFKPVVEGLDDYVIRVPKNIKLADALKASTSLTPASRVVSKIHIGNRLMELVPQHSSALVENGEAHPNHISILLFQKGKNLEKIQSDKLQQYVQDRTLRGEPPAFGYVEAMIDTVQIIRDVVEKNGFNPYTRMFKKAYALGFAGLEADIYLRNILYSKENTTLRMCDQENRFLETPITTEKQASDALANAGLKHFNEFNWDKEIRECGQPLPADLAQKYTEAKAYMLALLSEAHRKTVMDGPDRDLPDGSNLPTIPKHIEFAAVDNTKAVGLTDSPRTLVEQLRNIVKVADICR